MASVVALIPARAGSVRVPGKNVRPLAGHPLLAYSIAAARESGLFDAIVVSTDSEEFAEIARRYGAETVLRPVELAGSTSPDIDWILHALEGRAPDAFSILRPTSPFRRGATIRRAWEQLVAVPEADSIRAVRPVREHPGKMWVIEGDLMRPLLPQPEGEIPTHSRQTAALPAVHVQDSSLEIAWTRVTADREIAGRRVVPFLTEPLEGFSIDYPGDFEEAERLLAASPDALPPVEVTT
ncbi:MAG TPA: acylneuraminate cytidylyltransferase family protein [Solirubrobacteraceae bacterium]|nr:acylneuraminate cytidylyltransferase family protein [Solirubrobacteraceae bacterium]